MANKMRIPASIQPILKGISAVISRKTALTKALFLPLAIYLVLIQLMQSSQTSLAVPIVSGIISLMILVIISVAIHRIIIEEREIVFAGLISFGVRERGYLLAYFVSFLFFLPCMGFLLIPNIGEHIATVVGAYIFSRISLMFPSVSIDAPMSAKESWKATENYQVMMFTLIFLFSVFFTTLGWFASKLSVPGLLVDIFSIVAIVFFVGALSEAYKIIMAKIEL